MQVSTFPKAAAQMRLLFWLCACWILVYALFKAFPAIDTGFSALFCVRSEAGMACDVFAAREHWLTLIFRPLFFWAPIAAIALMLGDIGYRLFRKTSVDKARIGFALLAIAAYLVGPILIVNFILKAFSGRPRPVDTELFGGAHTFMPVGDFTGACLSNCSFVSGEAAAAGWLLCLIPLVGGRLRHVIVALMIDISLAAPLLRVAMGGHFLSDAALGWLIGAASLPALHALSLMMPKGISATLDRVR